MDGLTCADGLASVQADYWAQLEYDADLGFDVFQTFPCPPTFCPGAALQVVGANGTAFTANGLIPMQQYTPSRQSFKQQLLCTIMNAKERTRGPPNRR